MLVAVRAFDSAFDRGSLLAQEYAKASEATKTTHLRVYEDRNDNNVVNADEGVRAKVTLADRFTGRAVATGRSRTDGVPAISGVPASSYILRVAAIKGNLC